MTELGGRFIAALQAQGFGLAFTSEDLVIVSPDGRTIHHLPRVVLEGEDLVSDALLRLAIMGFIAAHPQFHWSWRGPEAGLN